MATLFIWCLHPAYRSVWGLGVISVFIHAAVDYPSSRPAVGSWTFLIIAMLAAREAAGQKSRSEGEEPRSRVVPISGPGGAGPKKRNPLNAETRRSGGDTPNQNIEDLSARGRRRTRESIPRLHRNVRLIRWE